MLSTEPNTSSESWHKRIANRHRKARDVHFIELHVVMDDVIVRLWPDEGMSPEVIADIGAKVPGEMIAALIVSTSREITVEERRVKPQGLGADAGHDIATELLAEIPAIDGIEVIKNRTVRCNEAKVRTAGSVYCAFGPP